MAEESRIKVIRGELGLSQARLAELAELEVHKIKYAETGNDKISSEIAQIMEEKFGYNFRWIMTGEGDKKKQRPAYGTVGKEREEEYQAAGGVSVGVYALAGAGAPTDLVKVEPIETITIPRNFHKPSIVTIKVYGRSMEPLIRDGAYVGVDREDKRFVSGEIYAVWLPYEGAVIKRVYLDLEKITLKSDNLQFPEITVPLAGLDENFIQGRVKWVLQML